MNKSKKIITISSRINLVDKKINKKYIYIYNNLLILKVNLKEMANKDDCELYGFKYTSSTNTPCPWCMINSKAKHNRYHKLL